MIKPNVAFQKFLLVILCRAHCVFSVFIINRATLGIGERQETQCGLLLTRCGEVMQTGST